MKAIREVLEKYHSQLDTTLNGDGTRINHLDQTEAKIKKIVLEWVGEGETQFLSKDKLDKQLGWCEGRQQLRAEIRKKIEDSYEANRR